MKKSTFLKAALGLCLIFTANSIFAQYGDYTVNGGTYYVTIGKPIPFIAKPDASYNPGYVFNANDFTNGTGYSNTWAWTLNSGAFGANATLSQTNSSNYVQVTFNNAGTYTLGVTEMNAMPGLTCNGNEVTMTVNAVPVPVITMASTDVKWCFGASAPATVAPTSVQFTITEADFGVGFTTVGYNFNYSYQVDNVDATDVVTANVTPAAATPVNNQDVAGALTKAGATYTYTITPAAMTVQNAKPTRYMWTLTGGINSAVSRKSDYVSVVLGAGTNVVHPLGAQTVVKYTVFPAPVTGPIYHLPNV